MGFGSHYVSSPAFCFLTEDYNEWMNKHYLSSDHDEKKIPKWFYLNLPYYVECEKYIEFVDNKCSNHQSHRLLVTCNYCLNDFKTFNNRHVRCPSFYRLIERKLKTYTADNLKKLASVYSLKRRKQEYIIDDLVQKDKNYIS